MSEVPTTQNKDTSHRVKRIYFVRHGQTNANAERFVPSKDEPLNEFGLLQAEQVAARVAELDVQTLIVSDFYRAQQTIAPIASLKKIEPFINPVFGEVMEPASLFGVSDEDSRVLNYKEERNKNVENPDWSFEDGEPFFSVCERIAQAQSFLEKLEAENILIVSHAFFIQCFTAATLLGSTEPSKAFLSVARTLRMSNTGISLFTIEDNKWRVVMHNDHAHFAE